LLACLILLTWTAALQYLGWTGFMSSDDLYYYEAGKRWLDSAWFVPNYFAHNRSGISLPIAASIAVLGDTEFAVVLPSLLYLQSTVLVTFLMLARWMSATRALLAAMVFASLPIAVTSSTIPSADQALLFWSAAGFWLLFGADADDSWRRVRSFAGGVALAVAFMSHETLAAFILFLGLAFFFGDRDRRVDFVIAGLGFISLLAVEAAYFWAVAGQPWLRLQLVFAATGGEGDRPQAAPFTYDATGSFHVHWTVDPILLYFTKHSFGIVVPVVIALFAILWLRPRSFIREPKSPHYRRRLASYSIALGVCWIAFATYMLIKVQVLPRYFLTATYFLVVGVTLLTSGLRAKPALFGVAVFLMLAGNLAGIAMENTTPRRAERALATRAAQTTGRIVTDPYTAYYAEPYLHWSGVDPARIDARPPRAGDVYLYSARNTERPNRFISPVELSNYRPREGWTVVRDYSDRPLISGTIARWLAESGTLPSYLLKRLTEPRGRVLLFQVPDA